MEQVSFNEFLNVFALSLRGVKKRTDYGYEVIIKDNSLRRMFKLEIRFAVRRPGEPLKLDSLGFFSGNMDGLVDNYQLNWIGIESDLFVTWEGKQQVGFMFLDGRRFVYIAVAYDMTLTYLTNIDQRRDEVSQMIEKKQYMEQRRRFARVDFSG